MNFAGTEGGDDPVSGAIVGDWTGVLGQPFCHKGTNCQSSQSHDEVTQTW